ncbi:MAG: thioredoxin, partial [Candidatus Pacebacteria bacterium CG10_big_fil_rev_8_21_14_0_10_44_11]
QDLAQKYSILSIPTVMVFKKGQPIGQPLIGFRGKEGYIQLLETALKAE